MISNLCNILKFLDTLELKEEKWKEITNLFCFLFFSILVYDFSLIIYFSMCGFQEAGFD